ncbi:MAG: hypothetical protein IJZ32_00475 [Clostridia bacterium]|nr:hypothetical protein [Clostridia bacterium]
MKKYFSWIACGFLVLCALIFPNTGTAVAGKGNGRSEKVTTVQEVGEVLNAFRGDLQTVNATSEQGGKIAPLGKQFASDSDKEYTSVTIEVKVTNSASKKQSVNSSEISSSSYLDRTMTCYFTENEAFYEIRATLRAKSKVMKGSEQEDNNVARSLAVKYYLGEKGCFVYYEYDIGDNAIPESALNKWLIEDSNPFDSSDDSNYQVMGILGDYILNCESKDFDKTGNNYVLKDYWAKELCNKCLAVSGVDSIDLQHFKNAAFSVNLNNKTSPFMQLSYTAKNTEKYGDYEYTMKSGLTLDLRLKNINNTVIKFKAPETEYSISDFE